MATSDQLIQKAQGILAGVAQLTPRQKEGTPSAEFAQDYNQLRSLSLQLLPECKDAFPPEATVGGMGVSVCQQCYAEVAGWTEQIKRFLVDKQPS